MIESVAVRVQLPTRVRRLSRRLAWALLLVIALAGACSDHRRSLNQYLKDQARAAGEPSLPSAEQRRAIATLLDNRLGPERIGPGDVLLVSFAGMDEVALMVPINARVDRHGAIELPLVGAVSVGGLELEDADDRVRAAYVPAVFRDAVVHVAMVTPKMTNVLVRGAVALPGLVQLRRNECNVLFAVAGAGGLAEVASGQVTLQRARSTQLAAAFDLKTPHGLQDALAVDTLQDGDMIQVHAATPNTVYIGGLVTAPRSLTSTSGVQMTVLQALAATGGLRDDISPKEATLIRRLPDGGDAHVKLNLERIASAEDPNILLAPGDILWVPHTWATRIQDFFSRNVFLTAGASVTYSVTGIDFLNRRQLQSFRGTRGGTVEDTLDPFGFLNQGNPVNPVQP